MSDERALVLSILTVQLRPLPPESFRELAALWQRDPRMSVLQLLEARNLVSEQDIRLLDGLADEAIRVCGNDPAVAAAALGGEARLADFFGGKTLLTPPADQETIPMAPQPYFWPEELPIPLQEVPGRYTRISEQGRGGMGHVFLVHDRNMGRDVAYKELLPPSESSSSGRESPVRAVTAMTARFLREARVTAQLEHPSIVPVYEIGRRPDGAPYYTMKLVRGRTLARALMEAKDLEGRIHLLRHFVSLCHAIAYAHDRGVIHRDIKPHNVMVGEFGETVVLDWGIAKVRREEDPLRRSVSPEIGRAREDDEEVPETVHGAIMGTLQYMPPEQARGAMDEVDERSDVYSLGVVLYELLTGTVPFATGSPSEILSAIMEREAPTVASLEPDAPGELVGICAKAMHKDRNQRYPSAKALAAEVEGFLTGKLVGAYSYTSWELLQRFYRRNRHAVRTAFGAAVVLLSVAAFSYWTVVKARDREHEQRVRAERVAYLAQARLVGADVDRKAFDAARSILRNMSEPLRGWEWGFLQSRCSQDIATLQGHAGFLVDAKYSPAGDVILTIASDRSARLWDASRASELHSFAFGEATVLQGEFSPDGKSIALALSDGTVRLIDARSFAETRRLDGHASRVNSVAFSADGRFLASASADQSVRLWELRGSASKLLEGHRDEVLWVEFSADSQQLLSVSADRCLMVWETATGNNIAEIQANMGHFHPQSGQLVYWDDGEAVVWDVATRLPMYRVTGNTAAVTRAEFSPSGAWLATGWQDGTIRLVQAWTGEASRTLQLGEAVAAVRISPDDMCIAANSREGLIGVWDISTGRPLVFQTGHGGGVATVRFSPDGTRLVSASYDKTAKIWDARQSTLFTTLTKHDGPIISFDISKDDSRLASVSLDNSMRVLDPRSGRLLFQAAMRRGSGGTAVAISLDGTLAAASLDEFVPVVWDLGESRIVARLRGHAGRVHSLAFAPTGETLVSASWDQTARIWNARSGETLRVFAGHTDSVNRAIFSPDGRRIATGSDDGTLRIWDAGTGAILRQFDAASPVLDVAFANERPLVAAACRNGLVKVWNTADGTEPFSLSGHKSFIASVAFNRDDSRIVTGSWDRKAGIWDADNGEQFLVLPDLPDLVRRASFTPDGQDVITADDTGDLIRWHAAPWRSTVSAQRGDSEVATAPTCEAGRSVFLTTRASVLHSLRRLYDVLKTDNESDDPSGLSISSGARADACAYMGVRSGDVLLRVDDTDLAGKAAALQALEPFLVDAPTAVPRSLVIGRAGETLSFDYLYEDPVAVKQTVVLKQAEAESLVKQAQAALQADLENIIQVNREKAAACGESLQGRGQLSGLWLPSPLAAEQKKPFITLGLADGDRITHIDGEPVTGLEQVQSTLGSIRARMSSHDLSALTLTLERGQLTKITKVFTIK